MDIMLILEKRSVSGLRELTQLLVDNLNFRKIEIKSYERWGGFLNCTLVGDMTIVRENSVKDSEIITFLAVYFKIAIDNAAEILENLNKFGFLEINYVADEFTKDKNGWKKIVKPNI